MPRANDNYSPTDPQPAIERLRELASQPAAALLIEGPAHPDAELLTLCAKVLDSRAEADASWREACLLKVRRREIPSTRR